MSTTYNPAHQTNIENKARRALDATRLIVETRLIDDPDFPNVTDLATGLLEIHQGLTEGSTTEAASWWVAIGIMHDLLEGRTIYTGSEQVTQFRTSRETFLHMLDAAIDLADTAANPAYDPFAGLDGGPF